jgi:hypothetical protein
MREVLAGAIPVGIALYGLICVILGQFGSRRWPRD